MPLVLLPPTLSSLVLYFTVVIPAFVTRSSSALLISSYGNFASCTTSTLENMVVILVGLAVSASILYLIARTRRVLLARLWTIFLIVLAVVPTCSLGLYTVTLFAYPAQSLSIYAFLVGLAVGIILVILFLQGGIKRYIAVLMFSIFTSIDITVWLRPSLVFLLLAVFPVIDVLIVYYGPLKRLIRMSQEGVAQKPEFPHVMQRYNPLLDLTVRLDGMLLGLGDFLLYSTAVDWSLMVLSYKVGLPSLVLVALLIIPVLALGFYINVKFCLKRGYGPATLGPLISVLAVTLILSTLL